LDAHISDLVTAAFVIVQIGGVVALLYIMGRGLSR
jgi:hypothetical protein